MSRCDVILPPGDADEVLALAARVRGDARTVGGDALVLLLVRAIRAGVNMRSPVSASAAPYCACADAIAVAREHHMAAFLGWRSVLDIATALPAEWHGAAHVDVGLVRENLRALGACSECWALHCECLVDPDRATLPGLGPLVFGGDGHARRLVPAPEGSAR